MEIKSFTDVNLNDSFFDSLKESYQEFEDWFNRKAESEDKVYVQYDQNNNLVGFLYLKIEDGTLDNVTPPRGDCKRLKVGTFKVTPHGTRFGERFIKKIMDKAIVENVDEIYLTIFDEHDALITLLQRYGFNNDEGCVKESDNGTEMVLIKNMREVSGDICLDYPLIQTENKRKFALSIYPRFHTKLFPDSILNNENYNLIQDISHTNSIHKIYVCYMRGVEQLIPGDILAIYRTTDRQGPAHYRSLISSLCVVEEIRTGRDFRDLDEFINYANRYSVFERNELTTLYNNPNVVVIKMTYNTALRHRVIKQQLMDDLNINPEYWGFFRLTDEQFDGLLELGEVYENIIIN